MEEKTSASVGNKALLFSILSIVVIPVFLGVGLILEMVDNNYAGFGLGIVISIPIGILLGFVLALIGVLLGLRSRKLAKSDSISTGKATTAIVLGCLYIAWPVLLFVALLVGNWQVCSSASYVIDQHGNPVTDIDGNLLMHINPCGTEHCQVISTTHTPTMSCLTNPFPGGW